MTNVLLTGSLESFIQLLGALFIFAVVLAATYLTTRWMGGMQRGRQNNKNLHVIETISVGNNKMISIVEVGSVYLVVSVGKEEVHLLAQLTRDQLKDFSFELEQSGKKQDSFAEILNQLKDKLPKKQGEQREKDILHCKFCVCVCGFNTYNYIMHDASGTCLCKFHGPGQYYKDYTERYTGSRS